MNGETAGMRIKPPYRYDLLNLARQGKNYLAIEVAINLGDKNKTATEGIKKKMKSEEYIKKSNIIGAVKLYTN
jgi:hypothetical protein